MVEVPGNDFSIRKKITQEKVDSKQSIAKSASEAASKSVSQPSNSEQIVLSAKAKNIQQAREVIKSSPEVRLDKVNRIKKEIADGTFMIDNDALAEKILKDIIKESVFLK